MTDTAQVTKLYRYEAHSRSHWVGDDYTQLDGMQIEEHIFPVRRHTPGGYWFFDPRTSKERWVSARARRAFAYATKEEALNSFRIRNARHIQHLKNALDRALIARDALDQPDLFKQNTAVDLLGAVTNV